MNNWLLQAMRGVEWLMEATEEGSDYKYMGRLWRDAQIGAYKKVANLLATIAEIEEPYPEVSILKGGNKK